MLVIKIASVEQYTARPVCFHFRIVPRRQINDYDSGAAHIVEEFRLCLPRDYPTMGEIEFWFEAEFFRPRLKDAAKSRARTASEESSTRRATSPLLSKRASCASRKISQRPEQTRTPVTAEFGPCGQPASE